MRAALEPRSLLAAICLLLGAGCADPGGPGRVQVGVAQGDVTPAFEAYTDTDGNRRWDPGEPFEDDDLSGAIHTLWMGGFGPRNPTGVHDPLSVRAVALRIDGELVVLVAVDALAVSIKRTEAIKRRVLERLDPGVLDDPRRVVIAATHTHQGPDTQGIFAPDFQPGWDEAYLARLVEASADAVVRSLGALRPARLSFAGLEVEGLTRDIVPPDIRDPYVGVIRAEDAHSGETLATLVSVANHPEAAWSANTEISADFPHALRSGLEAALGGTAVYFSADLGLMQTPAELGAPGFERARRVGEGYAAEIVAALQGIEPAPDDALALTLAHTAVTVPLQNLELYLAVQAGVAEGYAEHLYVTPTGVCADLGCMDLPLTAVRLGALSTLVAVPAELSPELVLGGIRRPEGYAGPYPDAPAEPALVEHLPTAHRFLIGLADAEVGYLFPKMTYDPENNFDQSHGPGPDAAGLVMGALATLLDGLRP